MERTGSASPAAEDYLKAIYHLSEQGAAVILSSHLLGLVEELCTRILVIAGGRLIAAGTVGEITSQRPELAGAGLAGVFLALTGT